METARVVQVLRWVVVTTVFLGGLAVIYRFGPAHRLRHWIWASPGIIVAALSWYIVSAGWLYC
ncbi:MAG: hypothetical protein GKR98_03640 [Boseongicola sp.]|nr:MAG: hypothetical protein GKR98_03640 [Boseongicola sp.]